ncbi:MAG: Gldg family protein, partial [Kiritimatiellae bacterium]|nr:Gldg family protein [Kiritimatiellia bacterium]
LAIASAALAARLALRFDTTLDVSAAGAQAASFSGRARSILSESSGDITATCFLPRSDARFREAARMLRSLRRASQDLGGARFTIRFVDPRWDLGAAERLIRRGVAAESLVFEKGRKIVVLPVADGIGEQVCAATVRRLSTPPPRRSICWTIGHGESSFDSYDAFGMSDIARDLAREGYVNVPIDLSAAAQVPEDCALVMVAGARDDFSRAELGLLDSYLRGGGRLLVLTSIARGGGLVSLLSSWGILPQAVQAVAGAKTTTGTDVVVSGFADHAVTSSLRGLRILLERPVSFAPSAAASVVGGADRIEFEPIARVGSTAFAAAVERGSGAGSDLAIRPTRIVAVGDAGFALNGQLSSRANANRDFFLNCVAYLAGTDAPGGADVVEAGVLSLGMDRKARARHALASSVALPCAVFLAMAAAAARRRRRR